MTKSNRQTFQYVSKNTVCDNSLQQQQEKKGFPHYFSPSSLHYDRKKPGKKSYYTTSRRAINLYIIYIIF